MDEDPRHRARQSEQARWDEEVQDGRESRRASRPGDLHREAFDWDEGRDRRRNQEDPHGKRHRGGDQRAADSVASAAETLSSVASWIERAQSQLDGRADPGSRSEAPARERRPDMGEGSIEEALAAIRRIEERLAAQPGSRTYTPRGGEGRIGESRDGDYRSALGTEAAPEGHGGRADASAAARTLGRRPLKPGQQLRNVVDEIRTHQTRLEGDGSAPRRPSGLPALGTLARSQTAMLTTLRQEVAKLASRIEEFPRPEGQQVQREVETLRRSMAEVARRDDLSRLEEGLQALTRDIMELRRAGDGASVGHEIAALQAEIRHMAEHRGGAEIAELQAEIRRLAEARHEPDIAALRAEIREFAGPRGGPDLATLQAEIRRLAEHRSGPDLSALQAEIRHLSEQRPAVDIGPLSREMQTLSRKLDRLAEAGIDPAAIVSLSDQIEHVRQSLAEAAAPHALDLVDQQLAAIRREIAEVGGRQVAPRDLEALRATVEDLRTSLVTLAGGPGPRDVERVMREFGQPIEATLASLVDKLERVERRVSDPEALDHLERQIQALAGRVGGPPGRDPSIAALERSMVDLLAQVSSWREGAVEAAEHAARTAVAETIDAMPVAAEVERHLMEFGDRYAAAEERTRQSLAAVHSSLSDVMVRLASLEIGVPPAEAPRFPEPPAARRREAQPAPSGRPDRSERRSSEPSFLPEADSPLAPPVEDEVLLEPGAGRPVVRPRVEAPPRPPSGEPPQTSDEMPDIKSSFIAAARRAAQAAAAESQATPKSRPSVEAGQRGTSTPSELLGRVRRLIDSKRRPLLLAAAAIILALGTMQIVRTQLSQSSDAPSATVAVAPVRPAESVPPKAEASADPSPQRGEVTAATTPAPPPPIAEPETTQSITPRGAAAEQPAAAPRPAQFAAPGKEGALNGDIPAPPAAQAARSPALGDPGVVLPAGIRQAAERGNPVALYELGARTADGRGVTRDPKFATSLFEKAAEKGLAPAQYRLGNSYERGIGVARDVERAKSWYRRAAEAGNVRAMHNLAVLLADGGGTKPDYAGAVEWFGRAAEHGVKDSQFNLAVLHARGLGTPQDLARAYHWLAIAAQQGDEDAARKRDEVAGRLAAADLGRAKAGAERWRATPAAVSANEVLVPPGGFPEITSTSKRASSREARV